MIHCIAAGRGGSNQHLLALMSTCSFLNLSQSELRGPNRLYDQFDSMTVFGSEGVGHVMSLASTVAVMRMNVAALQICIVR